MAKSDRTKGPNKKPDAETDAEWAALESTCQFLGKTFYDGDTICYRKEQWICTGGAWEKTGALCG